jgi:hypothetical protein
MRTVFKNRTCSCGYVNYARTVCKACGKDLFILSSASSVASLRIGGSL